MTSKLTRERIEQYANDPRMCNINDEIREMARMALAAMDGEPVGEFYEDGPLNWYQISDGDRVPAHRRIPLYRHAQPAPVVTFYRDGIEAAANYLDKQRESFDNEHGQFDPDTNSFEFGSLAAQEHSDTLAELAEGIRALHPNAGNSPVIPDSSTAGMFNSARALLDALYEFGPDEIAISEHVTNLEDALRNAAAPHDTPALNSLQTVDSVAGRWIPVSERMPDDSSDVLCTAEFDGPGDWRRKVGYWHEGKWVVYGASWTPTHWMLLPAAPQKVKGDINALIPLVSRNEQEVK